MSVGRGLANSMKKLIFISWLGLIFGGIIALFWYNSWKYQLPTPVPENYVSVNNGTLIKLPPEILLRSQAASKQTRLPESDHRQNKPVFLHFFNPDCPCSRFNLPHFKSLVKEYGHEMDFIVVVMNNTRYTTAQVKEKIGLDIPVSFDTAFAKSCGVYSTPQAVILTKDSQLYYRGNYNKNRYCTDKKTNYAQMAIENLLGNKQGKILDKYALTAYGCQLPTCEKK